MSLTRRDALLVLSIVAVVASVGALTRALSPGWSQVALVATSSGAISVLLFDLYRRLQSTLTQYHDEPGENYRQMESLFSLFALLRIDAALPPMRGPAISPDFAADLVSIMRRLRPERVVELGSGVSTLIAGYALKMSGRGRLVSLEEDPQFARLTQRRVREHGLEPFVTVVHSPLGKRLVAEREFRWYDPDTIPWTDGIDLLIVDGPRQDGRPDPQVRYPALPLLFPRLSESCAILVDDCNRRDEQEIVHLWLREFAMFRRELGAGEKRHVALLRGASPS